MPPNILSSVKNAIRSQAIVLHNPPAYEPLPQSGDEDSVTGLDDLPSKAALARELNERDRLAEEGAIRLIVESETPANEDRAAPEQPPISTATRTKPVGKKHRAHCKLLLFFSAILFFNLIITLVGLSIPRGAALHLLAILIFLSIFILLITPAILEHCLPDIFEKSEEGDKLPKMWLYWKVFCFEYFTTTISVVFLLGKLSLELAWIFLIVLWTPGLFAALIGLGIIFKTAKRQAKQKRRGCME